jgi:hypothetical protein
MKKIIISIVAGIILALLVSFVSHENSLDNFKFKMRMYDRASEEKAIEETLNLFNKLFASFFNTAGSLTGLNEFPAANMIKRRIFQEISEWKKKSNVIVYDKDDFEIESIDILNPFRAIAVANEVWFLNVQEIQSRKKLSGVKANPIKTRYVLQKIDNRWRVVEYEVYGKNDTIPPFLMERF